MSKLLLTLVAACVVTSCSMKPLDERAAASQKDIVMGAAGGAIAGGIAFEAVKLKPSTGAILGGLIGAHVSTRHELVMERLRANGITTFETGEILQVVLPADRIFYPGETTIRLDAKPVLHQVVTLLAYYSRQPIYVEGHVDDSLEDIPGVDLSEAKARAVGTFLWGAGINPHRVHIFGYGKFDTTAEFGSASGRSDNRAIMIVTKRDPARFDFPWDVPLIS